MLASAGQWRFTVTPTPTNETPMYPRRICLASSRDLTCDLDVVRILQLDADRSVGDLVVVELVVVIAATVHPGLIRSKVQVNTGCKLMFKSAIDKDTEGTQAATVLIVLGIYLHSSVWWYDMPGNQSGI